MSGLLLTNSRHYEKVKNAAETLSEVIRLLRNGEGAELACSILRSTMDALGEITGDSVNEELVDTIFSRFCIGK
jgi:tRNA modification GTPase